MKVVARALDTIIAALAVLGGGMVAAIFLIVIADVLARNVTGDSIRWSSAIVEYGLLVAAMLVAPSLVRSNQHIRVEILASALSEAPRRVLERLVSLCVAALCFVLFWYAADAGYSVWTRGEIDIRSIPLARWILYAVLACGFFFCAIEFLRQAFSKTPLGSGQNKSGEQGI